MNLAYEDRFEFLALKIVPSVSGTDAAIKKVKTLVRLQRKTTLRTQRRRQQPSSHQHSDH